jgi:hypothetical protein
MAAPDISDLISWWKLDETSGTRYDSHGSLHLSDNNTVGYGTGKQGNAADFEASNQETLYRSLGSSELSFGDEGVTWAYWVKHESDGNTVAQQHISIRDTAGSQYSEIRLRWGEANNTFDLLLANSLNWNRVVTWSGTPSTGTWYFILAWHDPVANTMNLQVNDGAVNSFSDSYGLWDGGGVSTREIRIGRLVNYTTDQYMDGLIDEVCVWNAVLSSDERSWLYNSGAGRTYEDLFPSSGEIRWFI